MVRLVDAALSHHDSTTNQRVEKKRVPSWLARTNSPTEMKPALAYSSKSDVCSSRRSSFCSCLTALRDLFHVVLEMKQHEMKRRSGSTSNTTISQHNSVNNRNSLPSSSTSHVSVRSVGMWVFGWKQGGSPSCTSLAIFRVLLTNQNGQEAQTRCRPTVCLPACFGRPRWAADRVRGRTN